jgi:ATP-dependent Zn protease
LDRRTSPERWQGSSNQTFKTIRIDDPGLVKELDERSISYSGQYENKFLGSLLSWVLPLGLFLPDLAVHHEKNGWRRSGSDVFWKK